MKTVAVVNQKGGVGKSTTVYHLARAAVVRGFKVLVVDLDPQANSTSVLTDTDFDPDQISIADVLSRRAYETLKDVVVDGSWEGLQIAPSPGQPLAYVRDDLLLEDISGVEQRLRTAMQSVEGYDLVVIDCAPATDQLMVNALVAAEAALIVTEARLLSVNGLAELLKTLEEVRGGLHRDLSIAGVVVNKYEPRTLGSAHWLGVIKESAEALGIAVLEPLVPKRVVIADALEAGVGLDEWGSGAEELAAIYNGYVNILMEDS